MNRWLRLKYVAEAITSNVDKLRKANEIPVRLINYTDVYYGDRLTPDLPLMEATASSSEIAKYRLVKGDVIITKDSETADDIGVAAYVERSDSDVLCGYHLSRIRADPSVALGRYVFWALGSDHAREQMSIAATGVTRFGLRSDSVRDLLINLPSKREQRAIAGFLDVETGRIDALISKKRRMIDLLTERRQALITSAVINDVMQSERAALRHFVTCLDGQRIPLNATERAENPGDYPYWGASGVVDSVGEFLFDEELVLLGEDGAPFDDPLRDVAFYVSGRIWVNNHIHVLKPKAGTDPRFLTYALNAADWMPLVSGSTRLKLTQDDMMRVRIPYLSMDRQRAVVEYLDAATGRIDALISKTHRMIVVLIERRQALITAAVTGELALPGVAA